MAISGQEIKIFRKNNNLKQDEFASKVGVTIRTIQNWERGEVIPSSKYELLHSIMNDNVVNEKSAPYNITNYKPSIKEANSQIPFFNIDFIAGNSFESVDNNTTIPDYYMDIPDFRGCVAFRAYSDSMEGLIKSGSILFGTKVEQWNEHLEFGQVYGIVCNDGRKYLKYIKKFRENPKEYFCLESENKFYDEFEMPKKNIRSIWLIHGHLNKRV